MENEIYKSPKAELETNLIENETKLATRSSRFFAATIDTFTIMPVMILITYFTGGFEGIADGHQPPLQYSLILALVYTALFLLVHGKIMLRDGQTWGKKALNIKIVTVDGDHVSLSTLAKRYGFYWGLPLVPVGGQFINLASILFIFSKPRRCFHDYVGGTIVVQA